MEKLEWHKIVKIPKLNNKIGKIINPKEDGTARFLPMNYSNYSEEDLAIVTKKDFGKLTIKDENLYYFSKYEWLGTPIKVHRIGEYKIVEYISKDNDKHHSFAPIHKWKFSNTWSSLQNALLHCICDDSGAGTDSVIFIINALKGYKED